MSSAVMWCRDPALLNVKEGGGVSSSRHSCEFIRAVAGAVAKAVAVPSSGQTDVVSPPTVPSAQPSAVRAPQPQLVVLFDGVCNLCNGAVTWLLERDGRKLLHFGALQSDAAQLLLEQHHAKSNLPDSIVFIDPDGVHTRSDAALRIASHLGIPWSLLTVFRVIPRVLRDAVYSWIARNRYRWFGKRDSCMMPSPDIAARFLSDSDLHGRSA